jgi:hypothetical protein
MAETVMIMMNKALMIGATELSLKVLFASQLKNPSSTAKQILPGKSRVELNNGRQGLKTTMITEPKPINNKMAVILTQTPGLLSIIGWSIVHFPFRLRTLMNVQYKGNTTSLYKRSGIFVSFSTFAKPLPGTMLYSF